MPAGIFALCVLALADPALSSDQPRKLLEKVLQEEVQAGFSGAVLVVQGEETLLDAAFGAVRGVELTPTSRFWISSIGKQFVSAAVLKAQENGLLHLDDRLGDRLPDVPPDKITITIRQLLLHQSGLGQSYASENAKDGDEAAELILSQPLELEPGTRFRYANGNYQLAALLVERVSGMQYRQFLQRYLLEPLHLENTGQTNDKAYKTVAPTRYELPERLKRRQWGSQGMYSTTHDLRTWYEALRSAAVLNDTSVGELFDATVAIGEGAAALGWFEGQTAGGARRIFTRGNDDYGANSLIYAYPDQDILIVVLTHAGDKNDATSWSRDVHARIEAILLP